MSRNKRNKNVQGEKFTPEKAAPPHKLTVVLSIAAILISIISASNSVYQTVQTRKIFRAHVQPDIQCVVRHNSRKKDHPFSAELVVWNNGPIKAVSVSVDYKTFVVDPKTLKIPVSITIPEDLIAPSILQPELAVGQRIGKEILGSAPLAVFVVNTTFYRDTDMKRFSREDLFFYESENFYDHAGFTTKKSYEIIMKNLRKKIRAESLNPTAANRQMPAAEPGRSHVIYNFGNLSEDGSWTNAAGTDPVTLDPLQN